MSRVEDLPPDLRAVLSLLVSRRQRYSEIAAMLSIEERAVHDRAHAALALLAPRQARELSAAQREQVGEYLLAQTRPAEQSAALAYLESSAAARAWAQALAAQLAPLSSVVALPTIPAAERRPEEPIADGAAPDGGGGPAWGAPPSATPAGVPASGPTQTPSSRRGGAILLGGLAAVVVVAVALIVGLGGGSSPSSATTSTAPGASSTAGGSSGRSSTGTSTGQSTTSGAAAKPGTSTKSGKSASAPRLTATLPLTPPNTTSKALGLVEVIAEGSEHAFILAAERLPPTHGFTYAAWLYNTPTDAFFLGGGTTVGAKGTLKAAQTLPANAAHYATIILTEQHEERPKQPGPIVLSGPFKLR
jgi:hypothetical protein